jgi:SAM-dependent methyltransferase
MTNYFASASAAVRYVKGRPYLHGEAVARVAAGLGLTGPVARALDVGCGTGLSTRALKPVAREIVGLDVSEAMVAQAEPDPQIMYVVAPAEAMPLPDADFDLATVACAFHWFVPDEALGEIRRILRPGAGFAVYGNGFSGAVREVPDFERWAREVHVARMPTPPRRPSFGLNGEPVEGFERVSLDRYTTDVPLTAAQMAEYLMSQSNATDAIARGAMTETEARDWLTAEVRALYADAGAGDDEPLTAVFRGHLWLGRRVV